ncbi:hypothetical protein F5Y13DRAFT_195018 [Hypoxylon sp. FL1857]|nr:hypothetical protein F5Y13DRAFT_195018 [Hypoxylon sp. FL1857]
MRIQYETKRGQQTSYPGNGPAIDYDSSDVNDDTISGIYGMEGDDHPPKPNRKCRHGDEVADISELGHHDDGDVKPKRKQLDDDDDYTPDADASKHHKSKTGGVTQRRARRPASSARLTASPVGEQLLDR